MEHWRRWRGSVSALSCPSGSAHGFPPHALAELALKHRLPGMFGIRDNVEAGDVMSYAPDHRDLVRRAATYIDKILKGAKHIVKKLTDELVATGRIPEVRTALETFGVLQTELPGAAYADALR